LTLAFKAIIGRVLKMGRAWRFVFASLALVCLAYWSWTSLSTFYNRDYRNERAYWQEIASLLPEDGKIVALTQDYGYPLMYYGWRTFTPWSNNTEPEVLPELAERFSYFVVTAKNQMSEPLAQYLETHYPIHAEGPGYIIYGLTAPLTP